MDFKVIQAIDEHATFHIRVVKSKNTTNYDLQIIIPTAQESFANWLKNNIEYGTITKVDRGASVLYRYVIYGIACKKLVGEIYDQLKHSKEKASLFLEYPEAHKGVSVSFDINGKRKELYLKMKELNKGNR